MTGTTKPFVSGACTGERCYCGAPAEHKVEETIFGDDPLPHRHPLTRYVCHPCFRQIMGPAADRWPGRSPPKHRVVEIEYDGFVGTVQGHYVTREGKQGLVVQQIGTRVVHVYGANRIKT